MKLSDHFSLAEMTRSSTAIRRGIDQTPPPAVLKQLEDTADRMEVVRSILGNRPINISSGYRSPLVNKIVGSSAKSDHLTGHAVDFTCPDFGDPKKIVKTLSECPMVMFNQLIWEGDWVHISFKSPFKREVLTAHFHEDGPTTYTKGVA